MPRNDSLEYRANAKKQYEESVEQATLLDSMVDGWETLNEPQLIDILRKLKSPQEINYLMIDFGGSLHERCSLLHLAASSDFYDLVNELLERGVDPTLKNSYKKLASELTNNPSIKELLTAKENVFLDAPPAITTLYGAKGKQEPNNTLESVTIHAKTTPSF